ncbi:MAG: pyridoxamine 5'-phosphate oxidase family protein [Promethearchaeota archaeon]
MGKKNITFDFIEEQVRSKTYGILSTINPDGYPHSTSIIYAVSPPESNFCLYCISSKNYRKVKNIQNNEKIAFVIPFPHHVMRFVPANAVHFQGKASLLPIDDSEARKSFNSSKILRFNLERTAELVDSIFIKIIPNQKFHIYGLGYGMMEMRKNHVSGNYTIMIPNNRY